MLTKSGGKMKGIYVNFGNFRKEKKGQVKIQQTAFVLLAITLFFILVGMFFLVGILSGLKEKASSLREDDAESLVSKLANSPEFSCADRLKGDCIDSDKVMALRSYIDEYENFWPIDKLQIVKVYPNSASPVECNYSNYPDCDFINLISGEGTGVSNFVALCRKEIFKDESYDKCEIAEIIVTYREPS